MVRLCSCLVLLWWSVAPCEGALGKWIAAEVEQFGRGALENVQVHVDSMVILAPLEDDFNMALGHPVVDEFGKTVPLSDGSVALVRSEWISGTPNVFGRYFTVDLGMDRAISRVRVLAGETALKQPEYFVRGYRLEAATQSAPNIWHLLAEQEDNFVLNIDTRRDGTWGAVNANGEAISRPGRFVRLTLIRQDRSNWVALGEIEAFGRGYATQGSIEGEFTGAERVNVGRIRWEGEAPSQTGIQMQFRGIADDLKSAPWEDLERYDGEVVFAGFEPVQGLQYRGLLQTRKPFSSPALRRLEIDYDPVLVAGVVQAAVVPDTARKGALTRLTYRSELEVDAGDYGVDMLRLGGVPLAIDEIRIDGAALVYDEELKQGGRWSATADGAGTLIELAPQERISGHRVVEIDGRGLFLEDRTGLALAVGSREQATRDGYVNWQNGREIPGSTWTVRAFGRPLSPLSEVDVSPSPFSPFRDEKVAFRFVVANVEPDAEIDLEIFSLDGRRVRRLVEPRRTGDGYRFEWDGRDQDGQRVAPGLHLYQIQVEAGDVDSRRRGTFVVAY